MSDSDKKPAQEGGGKKRDEDTDSDAVNKPSSEQEGSQASLADGASEKEQSATATSDQQSSDKKEYGSGSGRAKDGVKIDKIESETTIVSEHATLTNNINTTINNYDMAMGGKTATPLKELSPKHFERKSLDDLDRCSAEMTYRKEEVTWLTDILESQHFVVLTGKAGYGKASIALVMAAFLCHRKGGPEKCYSLGNPERDLRIDFSRLCEAEAYRNSVVLIKDALTYNRDLNHLLSGFDSIRLGALRPQLTDNRIFVVLTCDIEKIESIEQKLREAGILAKLENMDKEILTTGLCKKARKIQLSSKVDRERLGETLEEKVEEFLKEHAALVVEKLETMPRISRFIDNYFLDILHKRTTIGDSLLKAASLEHWFFGDLAEDYDAWCYCLALVLAQSSSSSEGARWVQFEGLRNALKDYLEIGQQPEDKQDIKHEEKEREKFVPRRDNYFLEKTRSEIQREPYQGADLIRFADDSYPDRLWHLLLHKARNLVGQLIPFLNEQTESGDLYHRAAGAMALGRLSQLDTQYLALPLIYEWGNSKDESDHFLLGAFFQGVLGSQSDDYKQSCLNSLRHLLLGGNILSAWAAHVCLREIGIVNLNVAMREMKRALMKKFSKKMLDKSFVNRAVTDFNLHVHGFGDIEPEESARWQLGLLEFPLFTINEMEFLAATRYCLAGLCLRIDPIDVIAHLLSWMSEDKKILAPMVGVLFLGKSGVAETVERYKVQVSLEANESEQDLKCGRILLSFSNDDDAINCIASFVERIYEGLDIFAGIFGVEIHKAMFHLLTRWAKEAVMIPQCRKAMKVLFRHLLNSKNSNLKEETRLCLTQGAEFNKPGSELSKFARDVRLYEPTHK